MPSAETTNVGKAVAARVGTNVRYVRTHLHMTQAQLALPEYSVSYISAIERGKIRPSLRALTILAHRLDVPLVYLLEGVPAEADATSGNVSANSSADPQIAVDLLQAKVLIQQHHYKQADQLLASLSSSLMNVEQAYHLALLRGEIHLGLGEYHEAIVDLRFAIDISEKLGSVE